MDCRDVRPRLLDYQRGALEGATHHQVQGHLETCAACAREEAGERVLTELLEERLPQHAAPLRLKRRLAATWAAAPRRRWPRWAWVATPAAAVAVLFLALVPLVERYAPAPPGGAPTMVTEALNDHLRILASQHPLDIESSAMHQVKPWFEGRLDFAPAVSFLGNAEFPLGGGAIGYFLDRKAAVFVFHRRLHAISLLVFPAEGLPWPTRPLERIGDALASTTPVRGFTVILWRTGELGYALVSDVDEQELRRLATLLIAPA
jgi:anti-sigma factor RsiW